MPSFCPFSAALVLIMSCQGAAQDRLGPGEEGELQVPGCAHPCRIYVPSDFRPGARHPLILFLHGSGGKPTSWPWRSATAGKGYLIVGLSYGAFRDAGAAGIASDPKSRAAMAAFIEKVRSLVDATYRVDQSRVFLTGLSMGGWGVNYYGFLAAAKDRYRGYAILAAGSTGRGSVDLSVIAGKPILLLNGAEDGNLPAANRGKKEYTAAGAVVEQVVLAGQGHVPSIESMAPPLGKWLADIAAADERLGRLAAVRWVAAELKGQGEKTSDLREGMQSLLDKQGFLAAAAEGKPVLVFFLSTLEGRKARPTKAARGSQDADEKLFSYPLACAIPAAGRFFTCFRVEITTIAKGSGSLLDETKAPMVCLLDRDRKVAGILGRTELRERRLLEAMQDLLEVPDLLVLEKRIARTRPLLREMQKLRTRLIKMQKTVSRMRAGSGKRGQKKLERKQAELDALVVEYETLVEKIAAD